MNLPPHLSYRSQIERVIAGGRVALAAASLLGVWWDSSEPATAIDVTNSLTGVYFAYAVGLFGLVWARPRAKRLAIITHLGDILFVSVLQYFTLGPSSPFFLYFVLAILGAALRWNWKGILITASATLVSYLLMTAWISRTLRPQEFEGDRFVIRCVYLVVVAAILAYLNHHYERLRVDLERLARWPQPKTLEMQEALTQVLSHAATIVDAERVVVIWEANEEPYTYCACWPVRGTLISRHSPEVLSVSLSPGGESSPLEDATFVAAGQSSADPTLLIPDGRGRFEGADVCLRPELLNLLEGQGLASASFRTEHLTGRAFFTGLTSPIGEIVSLAEVVAREIGLSLNQLYAAEQLKEIAAKEERIRVARDLHDGILQSLTGIRLELRATADAVDGAPGMRDRLHDIERVLAIEQRELRSFISALGPDRSNRRDDSSLARSLDAMRERIALEWKMPVTVRCSTEAVPPEIESAVPLMVHEAVVNALKHGQPSRIAVTVESDKNKLRIVVADDGRGFEFRGRHGIQGLAAHDWGPKSLLDRVAALGGEVWIESSDTGSSVEMIVALDTSMPYALDRS
jgi:signal transduction histidine kinase